MCCMYVCLKLRGFTKFRATDFVSCLCLTWIVLSAGFTQAQDVVDPPPLDADAPEVVPSEALEESSDIGSEVVGDAVLSPDVEAEDPENADAGSDDAYGWEVIQQINPDVAGASSVEADGTTGADGSLFEETERTFQEALIRMIGGLSVVLALILLTYYLVRRYGKNIPALSGAQLGQVIGQLHLSRDATLHYVRTGGRVLIIGVTPNGVNLVAEFGASSFDPAQLDMEIDGSFSSDEFVDELKTKAGAYSMSGAVPDKSTDGDDDVAMLRSDIHRLQEYLREESRETKD
jgi:flagellar biogenesis protein FliO